jgi:hypothetical protein
VSGAFRGHFQGLTRFSLQTLGFDVAAVEKKYCECIQGRSLAALLIVANPTDGDGEDALSMRLSLKR